jgi:hypothetical protein
MNVKLIGPQWRHELLPPASYFADSILDISVEDFLSRIGQVDFLVGGHEYWLDMFTHPFDETLASIDAARRVRLLEEYKKSKPKAIGDNSPLTFIEKFRLFLKILF